MILVFGGAYSGKLSFVTERYNLKEEDVFTINNEGIKEIDFSNKVIYKLHNLTYKYALENKDIVKYFKDNINLFKDKIIICDDISEGIVPLKKEDRLWRETTGKLLQEISKEANEVYRVFCGIPMEIKK
ncbi:cobalamin biosynthesis protein CobU [Clostridium sartagoforme]|uniref:Cobalamin biosynthesis protein CobU n=1 Tax=Clostridium sartagoforme TaxID=84031 RepID=A0A4S2DLR5_9CLOT|nr:MULTISPECIES: bifunctional adenosylcobinamide kinase/adenosylcobinamide-phosphate guanylyltransferase [Clostridium]MBS5939593.1 bifunctional adenosylcobinamide kinase/adenosylcobinamide-phosphate guanylyltransferase [Clostridium sp.]TGY43248.1 cobalamin biosynthesis protein CobU [Clostridium sartagoforme]